MRSKTFAQALAGITAATCGWSVWAASPASPSSAPPSAAPTISVQTVNNAGDVEEFNWPGRAFINWSAVKSDAGPSELPRVKLVFRVPAPFSISPVAGKAADFPAPAPAQDDSSGKNYVSEERGNTFIHRVMLRHNASETATKANLVLLPANELLPIEGISGPMVHHNCAAAHVTVTTPRYAVNSGNHLAVFCETDSHSATFYVITARDLQITQSSLKAVATGPKWTRYRLDHVQTANFSIVNRQNSEQLSLSVRYEPPAVSAPEQRFSAGFGIASSYVAYEEPARNLKVTELGLTGKAESHYVLIKDKIDVSANAFALIAPYVLSRPTADTPAARFYGFSFGMGYWLFSTQSGARLQLHGGWNYWATLVSHKAYGLNALGGPQLRVALLGPASAHPVTGYLKWAPIAETGLKLSSANYEAGAGATYQLTKLREKWPLKLIVDFTRATAKANDGLNSFSVMTTNLGLASEF